MGISGKISASQSRSWRACGRPRSLPRPTHHNESMCSIPGRDGYQWKDLSLEVVFRASSRPPAVFPSQVEEKRGVLGPTMAMMGISGKISASGSRSWRACGLPRSLPSPSLQNESMSSIPGRDGYQRKDLSLEVVFGAISRPPAVFPIQVEEKGEFLVKPWA